MHQIGNIDNYVKNSNTLKTPSHMNGRVGKANKYKKAVYTFQSVQGFLVTVSFKNPRLNSSEFLLI